MSAKVDIESRTPKDLETMSAVDVAECVSRHKGKHGRASSDRVKDTLRKGWRQWSLLADRQGLPRFPLTEQGVKSIKLDLQIRGRSMSGIERYRQVLADVHEWAGVPFVWSVSDVLRPLGPEISNGGSAVSAPVVAPLAPPTATKTARKGQARSAPQQTTASLTAPRSLTAGTASGGVAPQPAARSTATILEKPLDPMDALWNVYLQCWSFHTGLTDLVADAKHERSPDLVIELDKIRGHIGMVIYHVGQSFPQVAGQTRPGHVAQLKPFQLVEACHTIRDGLRGFMGSAGYKPADAIAAARHALLYAPSSERLAEVVKEIARSEPGLFRLPLPSHDSVGGGIDQEIAALEKQLEALRAKRTFGAPQPRPSSPASDRGATT